MKRKAIEKTEPLRPARKGKYVTTVQKVDNILVLNVYVDKKLRGRHALNPESGEYSQYRAEEKDWKCWKFGTLLGLDVSLCGWYSSSDVKERMVFDTQEQKQIVRDALGAKHISWRDDTYDMIDEAERNYQREKREKAEENRIKKIQKKMDLVPARPDDLDEWIWRQEGAADFGFFDKNTGEWHCTACNKTYGEKYLKQVDQGGNIRHNDVVVCPECKKSITAKKRTGQITTKTHFSLLQRIDSSMSVIRHFDARMIWDKAGRRIKADEAVRIILYHLQARPKYCAEIFYNQLAPYYRKEYFDNKRNPANRRAFAGFLYPGGNEQALEGTAYQIWGRLLDQLSAAGKKLNYNRLLMVQNDTGLVRTMECLFKGRFNRLLYETSEKISGWSCKYYGNLYPGGANIEEVFGISDRQMINRIRDVDGGEEIVMWMRWSCGNNQKISQDCLEWLTKNNVRWTDVEFIKDKMTIQQVMNYVRRQQAEGYKGKTVREVFNQWEDYLQMLGRLGKKADDEMMYRPRELKRRHDECVEEINRQKIIADMKRNARARAAEAQRMRDKFPGTEDILKEIKSKYEYRGEKYIIIVPQKLIQIVTEGQALHHCAGSSDRYFDRIRNRETYICFLRKADDCHPADYLNPPCADYLNLILPSNKLLCTISGAYPANY